jgi:hypothetical protein
LQSAAEFDRLFNGHRWLAASLSRLSEVSNPVAARKGSGNKLKPVTSVLIRNPVAR